MILRSELKQNAKNQLKNNWRLAIGIIIVCTLISWIPNILYGTDNKSFAMSIINTDYNISYNWSINYRSV